MVRAPVSTVDLGPTFLDFAGALPRAPRGMSRFSLRPVLTGAAPAPARPHVPSGLYNFRAVVRPHNATHALKFFCCNGHCPGAGPADRAGLPPGVDEHHLFNVWAPGADGRFETPGAELRAALPELVRELAALLPPAHVTPGAPEPGWRDKGYVWQGCRLGPSD